MDHGESARTSIGSAALFLLCTAVLLAPVGVIVTKAVADTGGGAPSSSVAPDPVSDAVAATAAEFRVDESGAATYSIPIYTVPGTAGVAPRLTLNYSSQGGYGPLGKGWSIGGLSSITRCRATREAGDFIVGGAATDGNPSPINFTSTDRYCLDGQRLIPGVGGAACVAVSGMTVQTLRTEIESFRRVCAYTPSGGGNGPAFFTVERKDGSISWYGDRDNNLTANRADGYVKTNAAGHTAKAYQWAQTRFQDSAGNYIDYRYHVNPGSPAASVEHLLAEVQFTGKVVLAGQTGTAQAPYAKVMFNYGMRPEAQWAKGYSSGGTFVQRWRLANIMSCATAASGHCTAANQARFYELTYAASASGSGMETLRSVRECRDDSKAVCAAPTTFDWSAGKHEFATVEKPANLTLANDHIRGFKMGDINGDGRPDLAVLYLAGSGCVGGSWVVTAVASLTSAGVPTFSNPTFNCVPAKIVDRGDGTWHLFDYNGDGRDDLFVSRGVGQGWQVHPSNGAGFNMSTNLIAGLSPAIPSVDDEDSQVQLADLNGDGLIDVLYPSGGALRTRIMERQGSAFAWGAERTVVVDEASLGPIGCGGLPNPNMRNCSRTISGTPTPKTSFMQLTDFNGDAASDLLIRITTYAEHFTGLPGCMIEPLASEPDSNGGAGVVARYTRGASSGVGQAAAADPCWEIVRSDQLHALVVSSLSTNPIQARTPALASLCSAACTVTYGAKCLISNSARVRPTACRDSRDGRKADVTVPLKTIAGPDLDTLCCFLRRYDSDSC